MSMKTKQYANQSLAASGFAVMSSTVAYRMRPDLWASGQECAFDFKPRTQIEHVERMTATISSVGGVLVLTRSTDMLEKRIEWMTGYKVESLEAESIPKPAAPTVPVITEQQRMVMERRERQQELAAMEPPAHDCHQRRKILAAKKEMGQTQ